MQIEFGCPSCRKKFSLMQNMNKHIVKSGCNNGIKLTELDVLSFMGIDLKDALKVISKSFGTLAI